MLSPPATLAAPALPNIERQPETSARACKSAAKQHRQPGDGTRSGNRERGRHENETGKGGAQVTSRAIDVREASERCQMVSSRAAAAVEEGPLPLPAR
jgi:hypothetical protein